MNIEKDAKKIYIYAVSKRGYALANNLKQFITVAQVFTLEKYAKRSCEVLKNGLKHHVDEHFNNADLMVFIMSTGISVRMIKDSIVDKKTDPAIIVIDECGDHVISLLSGHLGGANDYARAISSYLNSTPVITTATDLNGKWGIDTFAESNGYKLVDFEKAKLLTAYILEGNKIKIDGDFKIKTDLKNSFTFEGESKYVVTISNRKLECEKNRLQLYKTNIVIGMGCRRGTSAEKIEQFILEALDNSGYSIHSVKSLSSIDLKADEEGFLQITEKYGWKFNTFSADRLKAVSHKFDKSDFVESITGTPSVAEPSGYLASNRGKCVLKKLKQDGMTLSIWEEI
jgi:cobalt-precorrin 5A hydrolase